MSKVDLGRGAVFLFLESIPIMFGGYLFWLVLSKIITVEIIGTYSSLVSLATIFSSIVILGVPLGVQRFLGKSFLEGRQQDSKVSIEASLILVGAAIIVCSIIIIVSKEWLHDSFKVDNNLIALLILLMSSTSIYTLLRSIVISTLKTKTLTLTAIISTAAKFSVAVILILFGAVTLGLIASIALFPVLSSILLAIYITMILKPSTGKSKEVLSHSIKNILVAGIASWIPGVISVVGTQLGIIVVKGSQGAGQAGIYFISFSIVLAITTILYALSSVTFPALSAMSDGRKRFAWRIIKISLVLTLPLSSSVMFFSRDILLIFGPTYATGSSTLEVMLLSILPAGIAGVISVLVYSYGNYRHVLAIGLGITVPRIVLYFMLVPDYGGLGAGISYLAGALSGLIVSVIIVKKIKMRLLWKDLILLFIIPSVIAFGASYLGLHYLLGISLTLLTSYLLFVKFRLLDRTDLKDILAVMPSRIANPRLTRLLVIFVTKLNRSF